MKEHLNQDLINIQIVELIKTLNPDFAEDEIGEEDLEDLELQSSNSNLED